MPLTPPTVASDPASAANFNTALGTVNSFLVTVYSELSDAVSVLRERVKLTDGNMLRLQEIDDQLAVLAAGPGSSPTVATDPTAQAQANTALATLCTRVDTINTNAANFFAIISNHARTAGKTYRSYEKFLDNARDLLSPSSVTAITVGSDPVSQAHANAAFASVTAYIDTVNSEISAALTEFVEDFRIHPGNSLLLLRLQDAIAAFA